MTTVVQLIVRLQDDTITISPFVIATIAHTSLTSIDTTTLSNDARTTSQSLRDSGEHSSGHNIDWYRNRISENFLDEVERVDGVLRSAIQTASSHVAVLDDRTEAQVPVSPQHTASPAGSDHSDT